MAEVNLLDPEARGCLQRAERRLREGRKHIEELNTATSLPSTRMRQASADKSYINSVGGVAVADTKRLREEDRIASGKPRKVEHPALLKTRDAEVKKATASEQWFNLPRTDLTAELKRDLRLLKMRGVLDPKRHYKKDSSTKLVPDFSQAGTVVQGPTEYFHARMSRAERKKTLTEEVLATEANEGRFKRRYNDIQKSKTSGKKEFYKKLRESRSKRARKD